MSQDQLLHFSSTCLFLGFWVYALALLFYIAHAIAPEVRAATARVGQGVGGGTMTLSHGGSAGPIFNRYRLGLTATGLACGGYVLATLGLGARWDAQGYWPVANAFEAPIAFSWMIVTVYLVAERIMRTRIVGWALFLFVVGFSGYSLFNFGSGSTVIDPLRPALQSNWLRIHVGMAMTCYSFFALSGALSITYLVRTGAWRRPHTFALAIWPVALVVGILLGIYIGRWPGSGDALTASKGLGIASEAVVLLTAAFLGYRGLQRRIALEGPLVVRAQGPEADLLEQLDEWAYRAISIGLPMIAFVLMSGAIWAQMAWSTFWSWDPKEIWALITFVYYALYVHVRVQRGWRGAPMAALGVVGFAIVIISFLGLAYLVGTLGIFSLHTFGNVQ
ncbi:MAG TPA: c-type cytochrome biogenesis protein CcsB [Chloroflexota bacterium]|nr:c-type cytochrome biogenesis protein CcsB [Chloroflexota bacterium]